MDGSPVVLTPQDLSNFILSWYFQLPRLHKETVRSWYHHKSTSGRVSHPADFPNQLYLSRHRVNHTRSIYPLLGQILPFVQHLQGTRLWAIIFWSESICRPSHAPPVSGTCQSGTQAIPECSPTCSLGNTVRIWKSKLRFLMALL